MGLLSSMACMAQGKETHYHYRFKATLNKGCVISYDGELTAMNGSLSFDAVKTLVEAWIKPKKLKQLNYVTIWAIPKRTKANNNIKRFGDLKDSRLCN